MFSSSRASATTPSAPWAGVAEPRPATAFLTTGTKAGSAGLGLAAQALDRGVEGVGVLGVLPMVTCENLVTTGLADEPPM